MTDKPIMIDGVDVSECRHFNYGEGYNQETEESVKGACECITAHDSYGEFMYYGICKSRDCYYKQLKRKEQENKDLREDIKDIANLLDLDTGEEYNFGNIELEIKQLQAKEQENEELKKEIKHYKQIAQHHGNLSVKYTNKSAKLKQTLQEIKEMCELAPKKTTCDRCHTFGFPPEHELIKLILQKCEG